MIKKNNPFQITTPEGMSAEKTVALFVDVFTDFPKIITPGHTFLIGPRGVGKSMMFRYLQPDCQCIALPSKFEELPFLGIYVPLKSTNFNLAELKRMEYRHASNLLNEHILVSYFLICTFKYLSCESLYSSSNVILDEVKSFFTNTFMPILRLVGEPTEEYVINSNDSISMIFNLMSIIVERSYTTAINYAKQLAFSQELIPYTGVLFDYLDSYLPVVAKLKNLSGFPKGPVFLLVDDAHWLSETQTKILNSWVSSRTSHICSLKISTQYEYKTYYTTTGATIETPHDYSSIDMSTIYTGNNKGKYRSRIADIVSRRLGDCGFPNTDANSFFPEDVEQEKKIKEIAEQHRRKYDEGMGRGYNRSDDALRYSRADFIKSLAGTSKSSSTYSYAGFSQLVHLSSGIVRHFIEPAYRMYAETESRYPDKTIEYIPQAVQNDIVRNEADSLLFSEFERLKWTSISSQVATEDIAKLENLVNGLGGLFRQILLSNKSERRVFSFAFSDTPSVEVERIIQIGVSNGFFQKSTIGKKDSSTGGRTRLYVMNRRLSPIWNLDPSGFAGYLFVTNRFIETLMCDSTRYLRRVKSNEEQHDPNQLKLDIVDETNCEVVSEEEVSREEDTSI